MNSVILIGRSTKDPDVRYGAQSQMAVARFNLALDRGKDKDGKSKGTDFPSVVCFGKTAELVEKYVVKGQQIAVQGRIQTGKYEKDGKTVYTTDVVADRVVFLGKANSTSNANASAPVDDIPEGFASTDEDIPF